MFASKMSSKVCATLALTVVSALTALPAAAADFPAGSYMASGVSIAFDGKGHYHVSINGTAMVEGDYTAKGDQVTLTDKSGLWACIHNAGERTGTYRWKSDAATLTLTKITDTCEDREKTLTPNPWKKQG